MLVNSYDYAKRARENNKETVTLRTSKIKTLRSWKSNTQNKK